MIVLLQQGGVLSRGHLIDQYVFLVPNKQTTICLPSGVKVPNGIMSYRTPKKEENQNYIAGQGYQRTEGQESRNVCSNSDLLSLDGCSQQETFPGISLLSSQHDSELKNC